MRQFRFSDLSGALALVALVVGGSGVARAAATEVIFGDITPSSGLGGSGCSLGSGNAGYVCSNGQTFSGGGDTLKANGYSGNFFTGSGTATALTWKPDTTPINNGLSESGLGENSSGPTAACSDGNCEAGANTSVLVSVTTGSNPIVDVVIGSVQAASSDVFDLYGSNNGTSWSEIAANQTEMGGSVSGATGCASEYNGNSATCYYNGFSYSQIGLYDVSGNSLITAVSVPAPPIGHGLLVVVAVGGLLFGCRLYDRSRKNGSDAAALLNAA